VKGDIGGLSGIFGGVNLLGFVRGWSAEGDAAIVVGPGGSGKVEIRQGDFLMLGREGPQGLADDGVVLHFELVLIAEHEHCGGQDRSAFRLGSFLLAARRARIRILIAVGLFLAKHLLLLEILRVHLVSERAITLVVLVIGRARIPPPGIDSRIPPGIAKTPAAEAEAVVAESKVAETAVAEPAVAKATVAEGGTAESIAQKRTTRETRASRRNVSKSTRHARAVHSTEGVAPYGMGATETTVAGEATAMTSAEAASMSTTEATGVSSAMLCPHRHGQEKRERRDGCQAAHTALL
jgi:hypothetical protein